MKFLLVLAALASSRVSAGTNSQPLPPRQAYIVQSVLFEKIERWGRLWCSDTLKGPLGEKCRARIGDMQFLLLGAQSEDFDDLEEQFNAWTLEFYAERAEQAQREAAARAEQAQERARHDLNSTVPAPPSVVSTPSHASEEPLDQLPGDLPAYARIRHFLVDWGAPGWIIDRAIRESLRQEVDPLLILAMIMRESGFKPKVVSNSGAIGLMQILPSTAKQLGVRKADLYDVDVNLATGIRYLRGPDIWEIIAAPEPINRINPHSPKVKAAISAYNGGPGAVTRNGNSELSYTRDYVWSILRTYDELSGML